jgi:hypothetical protein
MVEIFAALAVVLVPMALVLAIGTTLMELLLRDAPRRGKRPDLRDAERPRGPRQVQVVTGHGECLHGTPAEIVSHLASLPDADFGEVPRFVSSSAAERLLLRWEEAGRIRLVYEW